MSLCMNAEKTTFIAHRPLNIHFPQTKYLTKNLEVVCRRPDTNDILIKLTTISFIKYHIISLTDGEIIDTFVVNNANGVTFIDSNTLVFSQIILDSFFGVKESHSMKCVGDLSHYLPRKYFDNACVFDIIQIDTKVKRRIKLNDVNTFFNHIVFVDGCFVFLNLNAASWLASWSKTFVVYEWPFEGNVMEVVDCMNWDVPFDKLRSYVIDAFVVRNRVIICFSNDFPGVECWFVAFRPSTREYAYVGSINVNGLGRFGCTTVGDTSQGVFYTETKEDGLLEMWMYNDGAGWSQCEYLRFLDGETKFLGMCGF